jgi:sodium transport system ATP-binding protein
MVGGRCSAERELAEHQYMIEVKNLSKSFVDKKSGTVDAVKDVSFVCNPGEIFGLLGPNGAGKTTLLRLLATILQPTGGTAAVEGFDLVTQPLEVRRAIGYVSTSTTLYERLTPREMITYFGRLNEMPDGVLSERIKEIFAELGIDEFANRRCDKLSTGQKQRVNIARTIIHMPQVLFFDEPTNGLDLMTARTIVRFIRQCKSEGRTVVFSTHIMSEVEALCDRIAVIYHGTVVAIGTIDDLKAQTGETLFERIFLRLIGEDPDQ